MDHDFYRFLHFNHTLSQLYSKFTKNFLSKVLDKQLLNLQDHSCSWEIVLLNRILNRAQNIQCRRPTLRLYVAHGMRLYQHLHIIMSIDMLK